MKRLIRIFFLIEILSLMTPLFFSCSSSGGDDEDEPQSMAPQLISSIPVDGATEIQEGSLNITLEFDQKMMLGTPCNITLNGEKVSATIDNTILTISNVTVKRGSVAYTLLIPYGSVRSYLTGDCPQEIAITFTTRAAVSKVIDVNPVMPSASAQTQSLYKYLRDNYRKKILSATMANVAWNIDEAELVYTTTGKYPAIATFDYIHLASSPADWIDYSNIAQQKSWWENNGIVSAGWHWLVPLKENEDSVSFEPSNFNAANATIEGTWENTIVKADLAKIASYLKLLQDEGIPVLWRPLHEASGNIYSYTGGKAWFWWGSAGSDAYKKLWVYMFNYFSNAGLNNLIWVWTAQTNDEDFYPGDDYVDIIGRDLYGGGSIYSSASALGQYSSLTEVYPNKMVTLSECGNVADIPLQWNAGATWSYFMPWYDYNVKTLVGHIHADDVWWKTVMNSDVVVSRDEMPSLK